MRCEKDLMSRCGIWSLFPSFFYKRVAMVVLGLTVASVQAATYYADAARSDNSGDGTSWSSAKKTIQAAVDLAVGGDTVSVTNGTYTFHPESRWGAGSFSVVAATNAVSIEAVNGSEFSTIDGSGGPTAYGYGYGYGYGRCVFLANGASLKGFTLMGGDAGDATGGGVYVDSTWMGTVENSVITGNMAEEGGGVYAAEGTSGAVNNCAIVGNFADEAGGGAHGAELNSCTLLKNTSPSGGGVYKGVLNHCISYYNEGNGNYSSSSLTNCCTVPMPSSGRGNFTAAPQLAGIINYHLLPGSPCIDAGDNALSMGSTDVDGEIRVNGASVDVGCDELWEKNLTGALTVAIETPNGSDVVEGAALHFRAFSSGRVQRLIWDFGDGEQVTNQTDVAHAFSATGDYDVLLSASNLDGSVSATVTVHVVSRESSIRYVAVAGDDAQDGNSWSTAKATIQAGVFATDVYGASVLVSNGVYNTGEVIPWRVLIVEGITVRAVSEDPADTVIYGGINIGGVLMEPGSALEGFTVSGGYLDSIGGGVYADAGATISNCTISGNSAYLGGGVLGGTLIDCRIIGNDAQQTGGGAFKSTLTNCTLSGNSADMGGGVYDCMLENCTLSENWAKIYGGGAFKCKLKHCSLSGNSSHQYGGGAFDCELESCKLSRNSAEVGGGASGCEMSNCAIYNNSAHAIGGGIYGGMLSNCTIIGNKQVGISSGSLKNCIVYYNELANYGNGTILTNCCTTPIPDKGSNNFSAAPQLAGVNNPYLLPDSPCIDAGDNSLYEGAFDIDGDPRLNGERVDVGCDEFWAGNQYGLITASIEAPEGLRVLEGLSLPLLVSCSGSVEQVVWDFGDGGAATNLSDVVHAFNVSGTYEVRVTATNSETTSSVTATVVVVNQESVTQYVAIDGDDANDGKSWSTAKATIQSGVDAVEYAYGGSLVLVSNGVYDAGGSDLGRVCITNAITVKAVSDHPADTVIVGSGKTAANSSGLRGVYLGLEAMLEGFTVTNGYAAVGGGIYCSYDGATVSNCVVTGNTASSEGGGVRGCTLYDCMITGNVAGDEGGGVYQSKLNRCVVNDNMAEEKGGGAYGGTLNNCLLYGNSAYRGAGSNSSTLNSCTVMGNSSPVNEATIVPGSGGVCEGELNNCIVYYNSGSNHCDLAIFTNCFTIPVPTNGNNNSDEVPLLAGLDNPHLLIGSPCIDAGDKSLSVGALDIDGEARVNGAQVDVGCDELWGSGLSDPMTVRIEVPEGLFVVAGSDVSLLAYSDGLIEGLVWDFSDGAKATNVIELVHPFDVPGSYNVTLTASNMTGTATASVLITVFSDNDVIRYVTMDGDDAQDGRSWPTAKATIQAAVDAVEQLSEGSLVLVSNGVYATGGSYYGGVKNRVYISKAITVRAISEDPADTFITGSGKNESSYNATRGVYLGDGATLANFTINNGSVPYAAEGGGGVYANSANAIISNCILQGNQSGDQGGGAYRGTLINCTLSDNVAYYDGGGASGSTLINCLLNDNFAKNSYGGGLSHGVLKNCTVVGNKADDGGGASRATLYNCIVWGNTAKYSGDNLNSCDAEYTCAEDGVVHGVDGNITNAPGFLADDDFRLLVTSPCIDAGNNANVPTNAVDLAGYPRIFNAVVDMGAYEFRAVTNSPQAVPYYWMDQYNLTVNMEQAVLDDPDGDHLLTWQEYVAGTDPTNGASVLAMRSIELENQDSGQVRISWPSVEGRTYDVSSCSNLIDAVWLPLNGGTNLPASPPQNELQIKDFDGAGSYRIDVRMNE